MELPNTMLEHFARGREMRAITEDEAINQIWSFWNERTPGRIDLVIRGFVQWESERDTELDVGLGWIRPTRFEPVRSGPAIDLPWSSCHTYGAGIPINGVPTSTGEAKVAIGAALQQASFMADVLAFLSGFSVWWRPARLLDTAFGGPDRSGQSAGRTRMFAPLSYREEMTAVKVTDEFMEQRYAHILQHLWSIPEPLRTVMHTAISWQAQAAQVRGLGRYVHYFASVELLATFLHDHIFEQPSKSVMRENIFQRLKGASKRNCSKIVRECYEMSNPSARTKIERVADAINFDVKRLFQRRTADGKSMYQIRNDVAHGGISGSDRSYIEANDVVLEHFPEITRDFVMHVARNSDLLCARMRT